MNDRERRSYEKTITDVMALMDAFGQLASDSLAEVARLTSEYEALRIRATKVDHECDALTSEVEALRGALEDLEGIMYSHTQRLAGLGPVACDHCEAVFEREITAEGHEDECVVGQARAIIARRALGGEREP